MRSYGLGACSFALLFAATSGSAQLRPQYSVDDIVGTFGCDASEIEGPDGECRDANRPKSDSRALSLARPAPSKPSKKRDLLITFANKSATLTQQALANARLFAEALNTRQLAKARFAIEGHTNAIGSDEYNGDLSQRRAQALANALVESGVDRSRLEVAGYGFTKLIDPSNPRSASNRRVEARRLKFGEN